MLRKIIPSIVKDSVLCLLSAVLLILSFPTCNIWLFAWFGFLPLFLALRNKSKTKAFLLAYFTGVIFWGGIIYWLVHVTLLGTVLLILYLALYFGLFGFFITIYRLPFTVYQILFISSIWVLLEYIRAHFFIMSFPWALLGYSQYLNLPVIQIADITGVWGVSFLVMMVNVAVYSVASKKQRYLFPVICIFFTLAYGYYKIYSIRQAPGGTPIRLSVIQADIPQELKWEASAKKYILDKYRLLTQAAAKERSDLIVWPEAASPGVFGEEDWVFEEISALAREVKTPLLVGTVSRKGEDYFNSALLLDASGRARSRYDKLRLVPFGEYIPLKKILPFLEAVVPIGDINRGKEYTVFPLEGRGTRDEGRKFSVLICFEDLFPGLSREFVKKGARFLVNITNDAWYKRTSAPYQHLQASVFRAAENRVWVARAANTGVSGFIDPSGRIVSLVEDKQGGEIFIPGYKTEEIKVFKAPFSFYTRCGDIFPGACILFILYGIILRLKSKNKK